MQVVHEMQADPKEPWPDAFATFTVPEAFLPEGHEIAAYIRDEAGGIDRWSVDDLVPVPLPRGPYIVKGEDDEA